MKMFRQSKPFSYSPRSVWHFALWYFAITALLNVLTMMIIVENPVQIQCCVLCVFLFFFFC